MTGRKRVVMKLHGFKEITQKMTDKIEDEFTALALCEGSIGLAVDIPLETKLSCFPFDYDKDNLCIELSAMSLILPAMFIAQSKECYWHIACCYIGNTPCTCGGGYGITEVDWN